MLSFLETLIFQNFHICSIYPSLPLFLLLFFNHVNTETYPGKTIVTLIYFRQTMAEGLFCSSCKAPIHLPSFLLLLFLLFFPSPSYLPFFPLSLPSFFLVLSFSSLDFFFLFFPYSKILSKYFFSTFF